jgi:hypothetical protein
MEQGKEPRIVINVRVRRHNKEALEAKARSVNITASDYHRAALAYAMEHMPVEYARAFQTRKPG